MGDGAGLGTRLSPCGATWALQNRFIWASLARRVSVRFQVGYFSSSPRSRYCEGMVAQAGRGGGGWSVPAPGTSCPGSHGRAGPNASVRGNTGKSPSHRRSGKALTKSAMMPRSVPSSSSSFSSSSSSLSLSSKAAPRKEPFWAGAS